MLLDNSQELEPIIEELDRLQEVVAEQQARYHTYKSYQKSFKVCRCFAIETEQQLLSDC